MMIHEAMAGILNDVNGISKGEINKTQGFKFRGIDTVYNELHSLFKKHKVFCLPEVIAERSEERQTKNGGNLIYRILTIRYHFVATDGSEVSSVVIGEGMDSGDKASNKAMAIAHKYALLQAFLIPTEEEKDPDEETHDTAPAQSNKSSVHGNKSSAVDTDIVTIIKNSALPEAEAAELIKQYNSKPNDMVKKAFYEGCILGKINAAGKRPATVLDVKKKFEEFDDTGVPFGNEFQDDQIPLI